MKIILHIGAPKTGSSAIQTFLSLNRAALLETSGVSYPTYPHDRAAQRGHPTTGNAGVLARFVSTGAQAEAKAWLDENLKGISAQGVVVLSSELFWTIEARELQLLRDVCASHGELQLVFYAGCQARQLASGYWQGVKNNGGAKTFKESLGPRLASFEYFRRVRLMNRILGAGCVTLRPYSRSAFPEQNIVLDFLSFIGVAPDQWASFNLSQSRVNETADASLYMLSLLNNRAGGSALWVKEAYKGIEGLIAEDFFQEARRPETLLSLGDLRSIAEHFWEDNHRLPRLLKDNSIDINAENEKFISAHAERLAGTRSMSISEVFLFECVVRLQKEVEELRAASAGRTKFST